MRLALQQPSATLNDPPQALTAPDSNNPQQQTLIVPESTPLIDLH